jgi:hypothetical protein
MRRDNKKTVSTPYTKFKESTSENKVEALTENKIKEKWGKWVRTERHGAWWGWAAHGMHKSRRTSGKKKLGRKWIEQGNGEREW